MKSRPNVFHIKSVNPSYNFVQEARCKHCLFFFKRPGNDQRSFFRCFCSKHRKDVTMIAFACPDFECNEKFRLVNQYVQLNLFDYV